MIANNSIQNKIEFHHVGLVVESIETSCIHYATLFGKENISEVFKIESQLVNVCFVKIGHHSFLELVEPIGDDSQVAKLLKKRVTYYHVGYKVDDIVSKVNELEALDYKAMAYFDSKAFNGKRCIFLFSPEAHLIELIEK